MSYQYMFERAIELYETKQLEESEAIVRELLLAMPEEVQLKKLLGYIAYDKGLYEQSSMLFFELLSQMKEAKDTTEEDELLYMKLKLGQSLSMWGKDKDAISYYEEILSSDISKNRDRIILLSETSYSKGLSLQRLGDEIGAKQSYNDSINYSKDNWQALLGQASLSITSKEERVLLLEQAQKVSTNNPFILYEQALVEKEEGNLDKAIELITIALDLAYYTDMAEMLGLLYDMKGEEEKALSIYDDILNKEANKVTTLNLKSEILYRRGENQLARELLKQILVYDSKNIDALSNLGAISQSEGLKLEAIEWYRKALSIDSHKEEVLLNLAFILHEEGSLDEAIGMYFNVLSHSLSGLSDKDIELLNKGLLEAIREYRAIDKEGAIGLVKLWQKSDLSEELKEDLQNLLD